MVCYFWVPQNVFASRSLSISNDKTTLLGDEESLITASASGFTDGETILIKGAFYQSGSSNYFGYTKNGDTWVKNSASNTSQRAVKIGDWDGTLVIKSDFGDSGYKGEGEYLFKVGFYYGTSSVNWSTNSVTITINEPDPTSTNTPTPSNSPTSTSTPTPHIENTVTNTSTMRPTLTCTMPPTVTVTEESDIQDEDSVSMDTEYIDGGEVLGSESAAATPSASWSEQKIKIIAMIITAILLSVGSIIYAFKNMIHADTK